MKGERGDGLNCTNVCTRFCLNCKMQWKGEGFNCKKGSLHREGEFHGYSVVVVVEGWF